MSKKAIILTFMITIFVIMAIFVYAILNLIRGPSKEKFYQLATPDFHRYIQQENSKDLFEGNILISKEWVWGKFKTPQPIRGASRGSATTFQGFKAKRDIHYPLQAKLREYGICYTMRLSPSTPRWIVILGTTVVPMLLFLGIIVLVLVIIMFILIRKKN